MSDITSRSKCSKHSSYSDRRRTMMLHTGKIMLGTNLHGSQNKRSTRTHYRCCQDKGCNKHRWGLMTIPHAHRPQGRVNIHEKLVGQGRGGTLTIRDKILQNKDFWLFLARHKIHSPGTHQIQKSAGHTPADGGSAASGSGAAGRCRPRTGG